MQFQSKSMITQSNHLMVYLMKLRTKVVNKVPKVKQLVGSRNGTKPLFPDF